MYNNLTKNNKGMAALALVLILLSAMLIVGMALNDIMVNSVQVSKTQSFSTKAFFAAEAGAERILWELRKNEKVFGDGSGNGDPDQFCEDDPADFCFLAVVLDECSNSCAPNNIYNLGGGITFNIEFDYDTPLDLGETTLTSYGSFQDTRRVIQLVY